MDQPQGRLDVQPDLGKKSVDRLLQEFAGQRSTRIRDDKSNVELVRDRADRSEKVFMRKVRDDCAILNAELLPQLFAKLLQERPTPRQKDHVETAGGYVSGECCPNAR
jgi:hypothetical protein